MFATATIFVKIRIFHKGKTWDKHFCWTVVKLEVIFCCCTYLYLMPTAATVVFTYFPFLFSFAVPFSENQPTVVFL